MPDHDSSARIHKDARIGQNVTIGPFCIIRPNVTIGDGCEIKPFAMLDWTRLGEGCVIGARAAIGGDPQVYKWESVESYVEVGEGTLINEMAVVHRSRYEGKSTIIGKNCFIMSQTHIGHDCVLGDEVIMSSLAGFAGHVEVEEKVVIGGVTAIHQFVKVGAMAMLGGMSRIIQDVPPYFTVAGNPAESYGLNSYALKKFQVAPEERRKLKKAYKILARSGLSISEAARRIEEELGGGETVPRLLDFIRRSERGLTL